MGDSVDVTWEQMLAQVAYVFKGSCGNVMEFTLSELCWWFERAQYVLQELNRGD